MIIHEAHVGTTRCVIWSTDQIIKIQARVPLGVVFIRAIIFIFLLSVLWYLFYLFYLHDEIRSILTVFRSFSILQAVSTCAPRVVIALKVPPTPARAPAANTVLHRGNRWRRPPAMFVHRDILPLVSL